MSAAVTTAVSSAGATDVEPVTLTTLSIVSTVLRMKQPAAMRLPEPETSAVRGGASLEEFNANIIGAIVEEARYLGPVTDQEFTQAAHALGYELPAAWGEYLRGSSWFSRGWLPSGCYLSLFTPGESLHAATSRGTAAARLPGLVILGGDGSRELRQGRQVLAGGLVRYAPGRRRQGPGRIGRRRR